MLTLLTGGQDQVGDQGRHLPLSKRKEPLVRKSDMTPQGRASDERGDAEQMLADTQREGCAVGLHMQGRSRATERRADGKEGGQGPQEERRVLLVHREEVEGEAEPC